MDINLNRAVAMPMDSINPNRAVAMDSNRNRAVIPMLYDCSRFALPSYSG